MSADKRPRRVLTLAFTGFTIAFAVWMMFGVLGVPIRKEFGLSPVQFSWLLAAATLGGALPRMLTGILTDKYGGRIVFTINLLIVVPALFLMLVVKSFPALLALAVWAGLAGNTFAVGIAWCSAWYPAERQGFALGVFGAGNVGASVTKFIGPPLLATVPAAGFFGGLIPGGWRFVAFIYIFLLIGMAIAIWMAAPKPDHKPGAGRSLVEMHKPLRHLRVWRFGLYYVAVFGAYVSLSLWLPRYYVDVYGLQLWLASLLTALYIFPASLLRPLGGWFSDRWGPRVVTKGAFAAMVLAGILLSMPGLIKSAIVFALLLFLIGVAMGVGKASVYRFIPDYYPRDVGAVGGLVGLLGAAGGIFLPLLFGYGEALTGIPEATWIILLVFNLLCLVWLQFADDRSLSREEIALRKVAFSTRRTEVAVPKG
ncbi:MAG: NarK/NasA family nitrate transporter [Chloroflexi bacterium]|nr:NarK/NasA family nitrate transporter [Chloroflexota bacterium]